MLSGMCGHSRTIYLSSYSSLVCHQVVLDVTRHFNCLFRNIPGFADRRVMSQTVIVVLVRFPSDILQSTDKYGVILLSLTSKNGVWKGLD